MKKINDIKVLKNGQVYKVHCQKTNDYTLLIHCADGCPQCKGFNLKELIVKCEEL